MTGEGLKPLVETAGLDREATKARPEGRPKSGDMTPAPPSIAGIVDGLSEAQKVFIKSLSGDWQFPCALNPRANPATTANRNPALVSMDHLRGVGRKVYRLTPLGLAVRTALQEQSK